MEAINAFDQRLYLAMAAAANPLTTTLGITLAAFGVAGIGWWAFALLGVRAYGWSARGQAILLSALLGGWLAWLIVHGLKLVVQRPRPFLALRIPAVIEPTTYSFPSGDAAVAFAAGTAIALTWPAARLPALLLALACALGRMMVGAHYFSDVVGGAAVGITCGYAAVVLYRRIRGGAPRTAVVRTDAAWLAVPDLLLVSSESIVRNLQLARDQNADPVDALDAPGHPAQLPQVLRGFGRESYLFSRGAPDAFDFDGGVLPWQGPSGDRVSARYVGGAARAETGPAVVAGELADTRHAPIGRNVASSRPALARRLRACERLLVERCEPLDALARGAATPEILELWRSLIEEQSYERRRELDDPAAAAQASRLDVLRERAEELAARLARAHPGAASPVPAPVPGWVEALDGRTIQTDELRVELAADGTFLVVDRASGTRTGRQNLLIDDGDRGDVFTFAHAGPEVHAAGVGGSWTTAARADHVTATADLVLELPRALRDDRLARSPDVVGYAVTVTVALHVGARSVAVLVRIDNRARDHRLRALCEAGLRAATHHAGAPFAWLERPNEPERVAHELVAVASADRGFAIGRDGAFEYAVLHDSAVVAITLLRAVGWLSRDDLRERRGHLGAAVAIKSAQEQGEHEARYTIFPFMTPADLPLARPLPPGLRLEAGRRVALSALRAASGGALVVRLVNLGGGTQTAVLGFPRPVRAARSVDLRDGADAASVDPLPRIRTASPPEAFKGDLRIVLQPFEIGTYEVTLG